MRAPLHGYLVGAAWICIAALAVLSLLPGTHLLRTGMGGHFEHILAYAGTALVTASAYGVTRIIPIALGLVTYAAALELLQRFSPGRSSAFVDFAFSATGVLLGVAFFLIADRVSLPKRKRT